MYMNILTGTHLLNVDYLFAQYLCLFSCLLHVCCLLVPLQLYQASMALVNLRLETVYLLLGAASPGAFVYPCTFCITIILLGCHM